LGYEQQFSYDPLQRLISTTWPDQSVEQRSYDANGNLTSVRRPDGQTNTFRYDNVNHLSQASFADGQTIAYTYLPDGLRETVTDSRGTTRYAYDAMGQITRVTAPNGTTLDYGYDLAGNRSWMEAFGARTSYDYDAANQLQSITDPWGGTTHYEYDPVGNLAQKVLPNGVTSTYTYDQLNRLTALTQTKATEPIASYRYTLGLNGKRLAVQELDGSTTNWTYDSANRLLTETYQNADEATTQISWTYDANGNRLTETNNGLTTNYTYNTLDQLVSAGTTQHQYDERGNLIATTDGANVTQYDWDAQDRLSSVTLPDGTSAHYTYDAGGRRVRQQTGSMVTNYVWDEASRYGDVIAETDGQNTPEAHYVLGGAELLAQQRGDILSYYLHDGQGSVRTLTNTSGDVTDHYRYSAFGELAEQLGTTTNSYRYTGQQFDAVTGLYSLRARFYNPIDGRFLSRDGAPVDVMNPVELNRYVYTRNSPIDFGDPTGYTYMVQQGIQWKAVALPVIAILASFGIWMAVQHAVANPPPMPGVVDEKNAPPLPDRVQRYLEGLSWDSPHGSGDGGEPEKPPPGPLWSTLVKILITTAVGLGIAPEVGQPAPTTGNQPAPTPGTQPAPAPGPTPPSQPPTTPGPVIPDPTLPPETTPAPEPAPAPGTGNPPMPQPQPVPAPDPGPQAPPIDNDNDDEGPCDCYNKRGIKPSLLEGIAIGDPLIDWGRAHIEHEHGYGANQVNAQSGERKGEFNAGLTDMGPLSALLADGLARARSQGALWIPSARDGAVNCLLDVRGFDPPIGTVYPKNKPKPATRLRIIASSDTPYRVITMIPLK
jgi:RHS repeat-associated protein